MVIVCAVSDGYYLPAPLTLLYASRLLSLSLSHLSLFSYSHYIWLALSLPLPFAFILHPCPSSLPLALSRSPLLLYNTSFPSPLALLSLLSHSGSYRCSDASATIQSIKLLGNLHLAGY